MLDRNSYWKLKASMSRALLGSSRSSSQGHVDDERRGDNAEIWFEFFLSFFFVSTSTRRKAISSKCLFYNRYFSLSTCCMLLNIYGNTIAPVRSTDKKNEKS